MKYKMTGKTRYRVGFMKRLILQIELSDRMVDPIDFSHTGPEYTFWKDATFEELQHLLIQFEQRKPFAVKSVEVAE